jgi:hypothetical protein
MLLVSGPYRDGERETTMATTQGNPVLNPVSRGECVIEVNEHSSTAMHGPTTRYTIYRIVRVANITHDHLVKRVRHSDKHSHSYECHPSMILTLNDSMQKVARLLYDESDGSLEAGQRLEFSDRPSLIAALTPQGV